MPPDRSSGVSSHSYLAAARAFTRAVRALDAENYPFASPWLAVHGLELALKAYLLRHDAPEFHLESLDDADVSSLWREAHARGLSVQLRPPPWHQRTEWLRDPGDGTIFPDEAELLRDLDSILSIVEDTFWAHG